MKVSFFISAFIFGFLISGCGSPILPPRIDQGNLNSPSSSMGEMSPLRDGATGGTAPQGSSVSNGGSLIELFAAFPFFSKDYLDPVWVVVDTGRYFWPQESSVALSFPSSLLNRLHKPVVARLVFDSLLNQLRLQIDSRFLAQISQPEKLPRPFRSTTFQPLIQTTIEKKIVPLLVQLMEDPNDVNELIRFIAIRKPGVTLVEGNVFLNDRGQDCDARIIFNDEKNRYEIQLKQSTWVQLLMGEELDPVGVALLAHEVVRLAYFSGVISSSDEDYALSTGVLLQLL